MSLIDKVGYFINFLLITADDLEWSSVGVYGSQVENITPNIDKLAAEGLRFTNAHVNIAVCQPSRQSLMTGRFPFRTDVSVWRTHPLIEEEQVTIASLLKAQGYHTAMVGKWHLGFQEEGYDKPLKGGPIDCGFDSFFGMRA